MTAARRTLALVLAVVPMVGCSGGRGDGDGTRTPRPAEADAGARAVTTPDGVRAERIPLSGRRVALDGAVATAETEAGVRVDVRADVLFAVDEARIGPRARSVLREVAADLGRRRSVRVVGHTDARGSSGYNQRLSERRASAVRRVLVPLLPQARIAAEGRGETRPVRSDRTSAGRAANRRVEIEGPGGRRAP